MEKKKFTFATLEGCKRIFTLCLIVIFCFSLIGQLIQSNFGSIKIEQITIDTRGAELSGELYYPSGTSSNDSLPGVVVTHGGGCNYGVTRGIAYELARRGFVVFNVSAYGSGLSTMPKYDELGNGENGLIIFMSTMGLLDAVNYLRSLTFVDSTRVGLIGHSMGAGRAATTTLADCGYFSANDMLINLLHDEFGQEFTSEEIYKDADELAEERLDEGQLELYRYRRDEILADYDSKLKSVILMGLDMVPLYSSQVVVGGNEVTRNVNCNIAYFSGEYDSFWNFPAKAETKSSWYATDKDLEFESWYALDDENAQSQDLGKLYKTSVVDNTALKEAIDSRTARVIALASNETHSKDFLSTKMTSLITKYFEQTLNFNRGDLGAAGSAPIDAKNNCWYWRQICNCISMFAMIFMIVALAGILYKSRKFESCVADSEANPRPKLSKKDYIIVSVFTVLAGFLSIYLALGSSGLRTAMMFTPSDFLPLTRNAFMTAAFLIFLSVGAIIILIYCKLASKKFSGVGNLKSLNFKVGFKNAMKYVAVALILIAAAYGSLAVIDYFFGQDYRAWMTIFTRMKADYWFIALRYAIPFFVLYMILSAGINCTIRDDIPVWKDDLICVIVNSLGIWLCALINFLIVSINGYQGVFFCNFFIAYQVLLIVPITVFISRKLYRMTNSIWAGAAVNALLVAWSLTSSVGVGDVYIAQTWLGNFLNF